MSSDAVFMSIAAALGAPGKSFEEVRIEDYLLSYQSSGRPPRPVPQEPTDEIQRKVLSLPPLFKPQTESSLANGLPGTSSPAPGRSSVASSSLLPSPSRVTTSKQKIVKPADIPVGQEFKMQTVAAEKYHNISCMPEYEGFSPEELRYYAYFRGNITSPVSITMDPFTLHPKDTSTTNTPATSSDDKLQSQCALPEYNRHSPEELRVAWILFGREVTSNDLLGPAVSSTPAGSSAATVPPAGIPPPVTAAPAPTAPKFNFVFR